MENKFKKGLILGGILSIAAAAGYLFSKDGQELNESLQKDLKALTKKLKKRLNEMEDVSKETFNQMVEKVVAEYGEKVALAEDAKNDLISALKKKWHEMEEEYLSEKEDEE